MEEYHQFFQGIQWETREVPTFRFLDLEQGSELSAANIQCAKKWSCSFLNTPRFPSMALAVHCGDRKTNQQTSKHSLEHSIFLATSPWHGAGWVKEQQLGKGPGIRLGPFLMRPLADPPMLALCGCHPCPQPQSPEVQGLLKQGRHIH